MWVCVWLLVCLCTSLSREASRCRDLSDIRKLRVVSTIGWGPGFSGAYWTFLMTRRTEFLRTHTRAHTHARTRTHTRTHAHTHAHTHTQCSFYLNSLMKLKMNKLDLLIPSFELNVILGETVTPTESTVELHPRSELPLMSIEAVGHVCLPHVY